MKKVSRVNQVLMGFGISATLMLSGCSEPAKIEFPVHVGVKPESITKGFNDNYYVTVMNGKVEGDGQVVEISSAGVKVFATGFDEPKGIVYLDGCLYFSDVTRVWKVDKDGKATVFADKEDFPIAAMYLNDVSVDAEGKGIFVADMAAAKYMRDSDGNLWPIDSDEAKLIPHLGRVYHVDLDGNTSMAQDTSALMLNPNGVGVDNKGDLMISTFFLGNILVNRNGEMTPLKGRYRGADAIEQGSKGDYFVSSWVQGTVWKIDGVTEEPRVLIEGLKSAADFYLEEEKGRLLLPDMLTGMVHEVSLGEL